LEKRSPEALSPLRKKNAGSIEPAFAVFSNSSDLPSKSPGNRACAQTEQSQR
jgi:hypothetical protein